MRCDTEYKCMQCGIDVDETGFADPRDADICGYCFAAKMSEIRQRSLPYPSAMSQVGIDREIAMLADTEIRLADAEARADRKAIEIYERTVRLIIA
ncbi:hypothetical protein [Planctomycetes bacterium TBK1r]|uniref:Zinc ribbon domain protein n=1 Tax=Stieleria magnilauensis TaxID=2527963 RepID=A0ABX5Y0A7_9BACT|nr:hypothetical protein TBK1r_59730 [Planctomycetes bacterium TBK1r]QDV87024.1 hypothetical protein TBK1r_60510 [Planctomycetes bacterium TBK1r]